MQRQTYIDINKSIETGYLKQVTKENIFTYIEPCVTIIFFCNLILALYFVIEIELKIPNIPDKIFTWFLFLLLILSLYGIYRKITEKKLLSFNHHLTKTNIKKIIHNQLNNLVIEITIETNELIIIKSLHSYYEVEYIFIITTDKVYFNIANHFQRLNPPVFFSHLFLKYKLLKLISLEKV